MDKISIIVPVYNTERFVRSCIESILNQTFEDIEVILIDDGSEDQSGSICDAYGKKDNRVRVIHQANIGLSGARNRGICAAAGKYLCFVDSDDCIVPEFCEEMYEMMEACECDFCACQYEKFEQENEAAFGKKEKNTEFWCVTNAEYLEKQMACGFSACAKLYRREIFQKNRFYSGKIHEDIIWSVDLAKNLKKGVCCTDAKLYYYRQNDCGIMAAARERCSSDRVFAGDYLLEAVKEDFPELLPNAFQYGMMFPWSYVDRIFVHRTFRENRFFMEELKSALKKNRSLLKKDETGVSKIIRHRMMVFSYSLILYGCNAYIRLLRLYLYKILRKDAYESGHGI